MRKRVDIKSILADPNKRRELAVRSIMFIQHTEGINTTYEQACDAYDKVQEEKKRTTDK